VAWRIRAVGQDAERLAFEAARGAPWSFRAAGAVEGDGRRGYETHTRISHPLAGDDARAALVAALLGVVGGDTSADFYYGVGALVAGHQPVVFRSPHTDLAELRQSFVDTTSHPVAGPELWWPQDRSWLVDTDFDGAFTDVFGSQTLADLLRADAELETLP
jgi:hypothetical protein